MLGQPSYALEFLPIPESECPPVRCNDDFSLSPSSPRWSIVPASITDLQLETAARHRVGGRFPSLACLQTDVPLVRASQAVTQRRSLEDERLLASVLGGRKRGFILEIVSRSGPERGEAEYGYVGWRRVLTKLPSLQAGVTILYWPQNIYPIFP